MSYSDPSEVKRVATKYVRKGMHLTARLSIRRVEVQSTNDELRD